MAIPKNAETRIKKALKQYLKVIEAAKARDVNESDTVTIITDMLADVCGYDKYTEVTREYAIRSTYCDLAVKLDDKPVFLIEVKAIGISLKENHARQAINYAANEGVEWVILTNADHWQAYRVIFGKPITTEVAFDFCVTKDCNLAHLTDFFFLVSKEGAKKSAITAYLEESQLTSRYMIASAMLTDNVLSAIRGRLKMVNSRLKISNDELAGTIKEQVFKRELLEGDEFAKANKRLTRAKNKATAKVKLPEETVIIVT